MQGKGIVARAHGRIHKLRALGQGQLGIAEGFVVKPSKATLALAQNPGFFIYAVGAQRVAQAAVLVFLLRAAHGDRVTRVTAYHGIQVSHVGGAEIQHHAICLGVRLCGRNLLKHQHGTLLRCRDVVIVQANRGVLPIAIVKVGAFKAHLGRTAIVGLQKLRLVAANTAFGVAGM